MRSRRVFSTAAASALAACSLAFRRSSLAFSRRLASALASASRLASARSSSNRARRASSSSFLANLELLFRGASLKNLRRFLSFSKGRILGTSSSRISSTNSRCDCFCRSESASAPLLDFFDCVFLCFRPRFLGAVVASFSRVFVKVSNSSSVVHTTVHPKLQLPSSSSSSEGCGFNGGRPLPRFFFFFIFASSRKTQNSLNSEKYLFPRPSSPRQFALRSSESRDDSRSFC
mmetsp:Transcript_38979/g.75621  ORF Transcript_38979/g.75621 Transcript_38979/m.75621 type:complete len:232 (-) Transcript_38979:535-1230(-)